MLIAMLFAAMDSSMDRRVISSRTIGSWHDWPVLRTVYCGLVTLLGRPSEVNLRLVDVLPLGIKEFKIERVAREDFSPENVEQWTVTDMSDQVVELVESRQLVQLTMARFKAAYGVVGVASANIVVQQSVE